MNAELAEGLDLLERTCQMSAGLGIDLDCLAVLIRTWYEALKIFRRSWIREWLCLSMDRVFICFPNGEVEIGHKIVIGTDHLMHIDPRPGLLYGRLLWWCQDYAFRAIIQMIPNLSCIR